MNLFILLSGLGLSHSLFGERLIPIGTLYDPFISRGLDALNYACYQDARFMLVATPSGVTLAPEGGAHQSIGTPLVGMAQDGLASFEPAFVDELAVIMRWAFDYMQREGGEPDENTWLRDETGGSVYLRLSTRSLEQPQREMDAALAEDVIAGAYWLRRPGPNAQVIVAYTGAVAPEAVEAWASWPRTGATSASWPSPPPTGSTRAGRQRSAPASGASYMPAATSSACSTTCRPIAR
jgi:pyruvate dehydrogenase E1 component